MNKKHKESPKDLTKYKKIVEESGEIRKEINEVHFKKMGKLTEMYELFSGRESQEFKNAKDLVHYTGGWPNENTPPRAESKAKSIAESFALLSFIGYEKELSGYLADYGFKLVPVNGDSLDRARLNKIDDMQRDDKSRKKLRALWAEIFRCPLPNDPKKFIKTLIDEGSALQGIICRLADKIKIENGGMVEEEHGIRVTDFVKAVSIESKRSLGKKIDKSIKNRTIESNSISESISIFPRE